MWSNYHTHSHYCDGKGTIADYAVAADEVNMMSLGISSHAPLPFECRWSMKPADFDRYLSDFQHIKSKTPLYKSLEVDYIPGLTGPDRFSNSLDYTVGSIHFVEKFDNGTHFEIDGPHAQFIKGLQEIFHHDIRGLVVRYFELTREMVEKSTPTIVGHLDKIKMQNTYTPLFIEHEGWYMDEIEKTLDCIATAGCILEVNTRGLYQRKTSSPYPSPWVLKKAIDKNIPITLCSDAHHPDDLTRNFTQTAFILYDLGFRRLSALHEGRWQSLLFDKNGFII